MAKNNEELAELVKEYFGINVADWGERESFDATNMTTVHEDKTRTVSNKGHFTVYNFDGTDGSWYKLAEWSEGFSEDEELIGFMKDAVYGTVKDYVQVMPKLQTNKYSLYKLIPYTVQGKPIW